MQAVKLLSMLCWRDSLKRWMAAISSATEAYPEELEFEFQSPAVGNESGEQPQCVANMGAA